jgi:hypothetical protein
MRHSSAAESGGKKRRLRDERSVDGCTAAAGGLHCAGPQRPSWLWEVRSRPSQSVEMFISVGWRLGRTVLRSEITMALDGSGAGAGDKGSGLLPVSGCVEPISPSAQRSSGFPCFHLPRHHRDIPGALFFLSAGTERRAVVRPAGRPDGAGVEVEGVDARSQECDRGCRSLGDARSKRAIQASSPFTMSIHVTSAEPHEI